MKAELMLLAVFAAAVVWFTSGCATQTQTMKTCKQLCTHGVKSYSDDNLECICKTEDK